MISSYFIRYSYIFKVKIMPIFLSISWQLAMPKKIAVTDY